MKLVREFQLPFGADVLCQRLQLLSMKQGVDIHLTLSGVGLLEGEISFRKRIDTIEKEIKEAPEDLRRRGVGFPRRIVQRTIDDIHLACEAEQILLKSGLSFKLIPKSRTVVFSTEEVCVEKGDPKLRLLDYYFNGYVENVLRDLLRMGATK